MTITRARSMSALWFVGSLCVLGGVLPLMPGFTSSVGAALFMTLYLQATRLLGSLFLFRRMRRVNDADRARTTSQVPVQAVWMLNRVATVAMSSKQDPMVDREINTWRIHQDAHARRGHGWLAIVGQFAGTFLVMWLFLTIGPVVGILEIVLSVLGLIVALSVVDSVLRAVFDAALSSTSADVAPIVSRSLAPWRDIAVNPPVCRWAGAVIRAHESKPHDHV